MPLRFNERRCDSTGPIIAMRAELVGGKAATLDKHFTTKVRRSLEVSVARAQVVGRLAARRLDAGH